MAANGRYCVDIDDTVIAAHFVLAARQPHMPGQGHDTGFHVVDASIAAADLILGRDEHIAAPVDAVGMRLLARRMDDGGEQHVGRDGLAVMHIDGIAAGHAELAVVVPFDRIARGKEIVRGHDFEVLAGHHQ